jgi:hypothetical protein
MADTDDALQERIRVRAYHLWIAENRPPERALDLWCLAERIEREDAASRGEAGAPGPISSTPSSGDPASAGEAQKSQTSKSSPELSELRAKLARAATYFHSFEPGEKPFSLGRGMIAAVEIDETGATHLTLANGDAKAASSGTTGGYGLRVPDELERAASGRRAIVRAIARAAGGGQARFALAYSTSEVGNSGWRWFAAGPDWSAYAMEFAVPPMIKGNGDYVGILPGPRGEPGVEVSCLSVEVVEAAAAK